MKPFFIKRADGQLVNLNHQVLRRGNPILQSGEETPPLFVKKI